MPPLSTAPFSLVGLFFFCLCVFFLCCAVRRVTHVMWCCPKGKAGAAARAKRVEEQGGRSKQRVRVSVRLCFDVLHFQFHFHFHSDTRREEQTNTRSHSHTLYSRPVTLLSTDTSHYTTHTSSRIFSLFAHTVSH